MLKCNTFFIIGIIHFPDKYSPDIVPILPMGNFSGHAPARTPLTDRVLLQPIGYSASDYLMAKTTADTKI